jgi:hypothetical protein
MIKDINKPTIFTLENGYSTVSISVAGSDLTLEDTMQYIERLLLATGYAPENIKEYLGEE